MAYKRKTHDEYEIWGNWGYGWDFVCTAEGINEEARRDSRELLKCYRENEPMATFRVRKFRRANGECTA